MPHPATEQDQQHDSADDNKYTQNAVQHILLFTLPPRVVRSQRDRSLSCYFSLSVGLPSCHPHFSAAKVPWVQRSDPIRMMGSMRKMGVIRWDIHRKRRSSTMIRPIHTSHSSHASHISQTVARTALVSPRHLLVADGEEAAVRQLDRQGIAQVPVRAIVGHPKYPNGSPGRRQIMPCSASTFPPITLLAWRPGQR